MNRRLLLYVVAAMALGLFIGQPSAGWIGAKSALVSTLTLVAVFFIVYPTMIIDKWRTLLLLLVPNALFMAITLAVAIAAMAFLPLVAVPAATMPIFQIVLLVSYLKLAGWLRMYFGEPPKVAGA